MKRFVIKAVPALLLVFTLLGCTGNYLKINSDPYGATDEELTRDGYDIMTTIAGLASSIVSEDINTAQFTDVLLGGPMGGYYASSGSWGNTITNFNASDDWTNVFMASSRVVPTLYSNLSKLKSLTDDPIILAIANILKVCAMNRVTDCYGPIPYTAIGDDANELGKVPYDSQEKVYDTMFAELDAAIAILENNLDGGIPEIVDPVYGGSVVKWCRFANSMKLRLAMRIVYADKDKAKEMAEGAVKHPLGVITSNEDIAKITSIFTSEGNPMYVAIQYNHPSDSKTGGDTHAAADIICYMNGYEDPRRPEYFVKSEWPGIDYVGMRRSIEIPPLTTIGRKYSGVNLSPSSPIFWMNAAEVAFLKAEAVAVFGFDMGGGSAGDFYNEGIRLSFDQWGVSGNYASYVANSALEPETYTDPADLNTYNTSLSKITIKWDEGATVAQKQERILIQKWIANYHLGNEAWADYRRTGFPKLMPATAAGNKSSGKSVDSEKGARRMPYPQIEYTNNANNVQYAVSEWLKSDSWGARMWWDCNPDIK